MQGRYAPPLREAEIGATYYLSDDTTFGDADDRRMGFALFAVSMDSGATYPISLSQTQLDNMAAFWGEDEDLVDAGQYYVYTKARAYLFDSGGNDVLVGRPATTGPFCTTHPVTTGLVRHRIMPSCVPPPAAPTLTVPTA